MTKKISVMVLGDLAIARAALRLLVQSHEHLNVIGEAPVAATALDLNGHERPDIVLLDCDPQPERALLVLPELLQQPLQRWQVMLLTDSRDPDFQRRAIQLGARGLVSKDMTPEILFKAIERVNAGEAWFERVMIANALGEMSRMNGQDPDPDAARIATLSKREREVVVLIGEGLKNKQIAERLFISETTVQHHLSSIFGKLGVADRLELVIYAYRQGLVKLPLDFKRKAEFSRRK